MRVVSYFIRIDFIVLCLASMNGFHVEGMPRDKWNVVIFTESCYPASCEHAFGGNNQIITGWLYCLGKVFGGSVHVLM